LSDLSAWLKRVFGRPPADVARFERALTHSSQSEHNYERLEFLGDRVLGLTMAEWLFELFPDEPEGNLSKRFNTLVSGATCAEIARELGAREHLRLGKQARDDGALDSDNVLGDVVESLLGAFYLEAGLEEARAVVRRLWGSRVHAQGKAPQHPKSQLQEWAAANNRKAPEYEIADRSGPHHAPRFTVVVRVGRTHEASASGTSKQEAETAAAKALLGQLRDVTPARGRRNASA
jgi:ribonuclease-3